MAIVVSSLIRAALLNGAVEQYAENEMTFGEGGDHEKFV